MMGHDWTRRPTPIADTLAGRNTRLKDTNPKDAIGSAKVPLGLLSPIAKAHWAAAQQLGKV